MAMGQSIEDMTLDFEANFGEDELQLINAAVDIGEAAPAGTEIRCTPCNASFTTQRALARHLKQTKRHRTDDGDSGRLFKCPCIP